MRKCSKLFFLAALILLIASVASTFVTAEEPTSLTIVLPGDRPQDMDLVAAELEKAAGKEIGPIKLNFQFFAFPDFPNKVALMATAGEQMDLVFDPFWLNFYQMQAQGAFMPIDNYIKNLSFYGKPGNIPAPVWSAVTVEGKIYGLPALEHNYLRQDMVPVVVRKDLLTKYAPKGIKTGKEFLAFCKAVHKNEPQLLLFCQNDVVTNPSEAIYYGKKSQALAPWGWFGDTALNFYVDASGKSGKAAPKVFSYYFTPEFENDVAATAQLRKDGLYSDEVIKDKRASFIAGRMAFFGGDVYDYSQSVGPAVKDSFGAVWLKLDQQPKGVMQRATGNWFCIGAKSKVPEKAAAFVNWIMSAQANYELWAYGIKGVHFNINAKNAIEKIDPEKQRYEMLWWYVFNRATQRQDFSDYPDASAYIKWADDDKNCFPNPAIGFPLDTEPVKTEIAQLNAAISEYRALMVGKGDTKKQIVEFRNKLKQAGIDKVLAEYQKQFDAWWAKNK